MPIGAEIKPLTIPEMAFENNPILISIFVSFSFKKSK